MRENDLRVVQTRRALREALLALLKTQTLETVSVSALCREAGVSRGAFYLHFKDVRALFDEQVRQLLLDLEQSYFEPYRHVDVLVPSRLDPSTIRMFHHVKKYQSFYEIVFDRQSPLAYYLALFEKIKSLIRESASSVPQGKADRRLSVAYEANAIMGLLLAWSEEGFAASPSSMNEQLTAILSKRGRDDS